MYFVINITERRCLEKNYVVVTGSVADVAMVNAYKEVAGPIMKKFGGVMPPQSYKVGEVLAGNFKSEFLLKIEFPNLESIAGAFGAEEYKAVIGERDQGFSDLNIFILTEESK